jgi:hypothetical protein
MDSVGSGGEFEGPAPTLIIRIICIWIAGGNGKHACPQAVSHYMGDERWVMVKADSGQLVSRPSCLSARVNNNKLRAKISLILDTAAFWLRCEMSCRKRSSWPMQGYTTVWLRLLKIAVRVMATATRARLAFGVDCREAALFRGVVGVLALACPGVIMRSYRPRCVLLSQRICPS